MQMWEYSSAGMALTKSFEGLRLEAYQDSAGRWTIGYGHAGPEVRPGQRIEAAQAEELLRGDLAAAVECIRHAVRVEVSQSQFDALVDFCFNVGRGSLLESTLLMHVNRGEFASAAEQFPLWAHAGGKLVPGLLRRRTAEAQMFLGRNLQPSLSAQVRPNVSVKSLL